MSRTIEKELVNLLINKPNNINFLVNVIISFDMYRKQAQTDNDLLEDIEFKEDNDGNSYEVIIYTFYYHSKVATHLKSPNQIKEWAKYEIDEFN